MRKMFAVLVLTALASGCGGEEASPAPGATTTTVSAYDLAFARCAEVARQRWETDLERGIPYPSTHARVLEVTGCAELQLAGG
jgi:hypothetical protein